MKQGKHTLGPWTVIGTLDSLTVCNIDSDNPNSCDRVRQVAHVVCGDYEIPDYDEHRANAALIAQAPQLKSDREELIAALKTAVVAFDADDHTLAINLMDGVRATLTRLEPKQ